MKKKLKLSTCLFLLSLMANAMGAEVVCRSLTFGAFVTRDAGTQDPDALTYCAEVANDERGEESQLSNITVKGMFSEPKSLAATKKNAKFICKKLVSGKVLEFNSSAEKIGTDLEGSIKHISHPQKAFDNGHYVSRPRNVIMVPELIPAFETLTCLKYK